MNKKLWLALLLVPALSVAQDVHPCTEQLLPLTTEDQLLQVIYCEYPKAKLLRFELVESDDGEVTYHVRLLDGERIQVLVYRLADGKLLEGE